MLTQHSANTWDLRGSVAPGGQYPGGTPAPRADLRFGIDDAGWIHLVTTRDGVVRRLVPEFDDVTIPSGGAAARLLLAFLIVAASFPALGRRSS